MKAKRIILIVVLLLIAGLGYLFYAQNAATKVNLIFKLPFGLAWDLGPDGVMLPMVLLVTFLVGMVVSALVLGGLVLRANRRARGLERQSSSLKDELSFGGGRTSSGSRPFPKSPPADDDDDLI
jgi:hypothetical protein